LMPASRSSRALRSNSPSTKAPGPRLVLHGNEFPGARKRLRSAAARRLKRKYRRRRALGATRPPHTRSAARRSCSPPWAGRYLTVRCQHRDAAGSCAPTAASGGPEHRDAAAEQTRSTSASPVGHVHGVHAGGTVQRRQRRAARAVTGDA
jgi:hypothetical protein